MLYTNKPLAAKLVTTSILTHLPYSFARFIDQNGLSVVKIRDNIETYDVIRDLSVSEKNILSVLQRHLKVKSNGKQVF